MINNIFYLPDIYLPGVMLSGVIIGWLFGKLLTRQVLISAAVLFLIYSTGQLLFRVLEGDHPLRFIGQITYYIIFLTFLGIGSKLVRVWEQRES